MSGSTTGRSESHATPPNTGKGGDPTQVPEVGPLLSGGGELVPREEHNTALKGPKTMAHRELVAVAIPVHCGHPTHPLLQERFTHPGMHLVRLSAGHGAPLSQRLQTLFHRSYRWLLNA